MGARACRTRTFAPPPSLTMLPDAGIEAPPASGILGRAVSLRPGEARAALLSATYFFFLLASYSVLRPIRDEMGVLGGVRNLAWLFSATLGTMLLLQPLFGALVSRLGRARFVPLCYRFFALTLVAFFVALEALDGEARVWVGRAFYVWVSVFNLFVVSVFWAFLVDIFRPEQARRMFGLIGVGGTLGAIVGAALTAFLVQDLGARNLLLVSVVLLESAVWCVWILGREVRTGSFIRAREASQFASPAGEGGALAETALGGRAWDGVRAVGRSPYLAQICLFIGFFTVGSTFLYFQQAEIVEAQLADSAARTGLFASIDLAVNILTLLTQLFVTGRVLGRLGLGIGLVLLPALSIVGFSVLATAPGLAAVVGFQVLRRAGNFALMRPSREVLFTVVPRADKYKAKNFIDTFVYRLGDQVGAWSFTLLAGLGLLTGGISLVAALLSAGWLANALLLARRYRSEALRSAAAADPQAALPLVVPH